MSGLVVDLFAGGGGASEGIRRALGRDPDVAVNHDAIAVAMHRENHPGTRHFCQDVWEVSPRWATQGNAVSLLWASPDCTHFSRAKGAAPKRDIKRRSLAWVVERWAREVRPEVIILENVGEFLTWGPLDCSGHPVKCQAGTTFRAFVRRLRRHGYVVEWRELRACDYGAPTIRKRLFLIARCDGLPITWPEPTHGPVRPLPWRTAAEIIDWSIPCPSIFERKRPLAEATQRRIAEGIRRYVIEAAEPFIVTYYGEKARGDFRGCGMGDPIATQTTENRHALVTPTIIPIQHYNGSNIAHSIDEPLRTITAQPKGGSFALMMPHLQRQFGKSVGQEAIEPVGTITAGGSGKTALVSAFLAKLYGGVVGSELSGPIGTVTSVDHHSLVSSSLIKLRGTCQAGQPVGEVRAFLTKYYGTGGQLAPCTDPVHTIPTKDRMGLVTVTINGEPYTIADIGMRMLSPRELFRAQGFEDWYQIDLEHNGRRFSKVDQVRLCGNSVCPPIAEALVQANCTVAMQEAGHA